MSPINELLEPLEQSPLLPELVQKLLARIQEEESLRQKFYQEMTPEQKVEFISGEVVLHSPARRKHLEVSIRTASLLRAFVSVKKLGTVLSEKCLCVFPRNDYEPDIVFFNKDKASGLDADTLKFPVPDLAVEVLSKSTEGNDRGVKFEDFAAHGVGEYWIIDTVAETVEQYLLRDHTFELRMKAGSGELVGEVVEGFEIPVKAIFDEEANLAALRDLL